MLLVRHLSYQDSEAIVHMKQNATIPTEQQYSQYATDRPLYSLLTIEMPNCCNSLIKAHSSTKLPSPKLRSCVNFR